MSDMSFRQAKELVERMEFSEIALKKAVSNLEKSSNSFEKRSKIFDITLKEQEKVLSKVPEANKKISLMFIIIALNIGFIIGLFFGKYIL